MAQTVNQEQQPQQLDKQRQNQSSDCKTLASNNPEIASKGGRIQSKFYQTTGGKQGSSAQPNSTAIYPPATNCVHQTQSSSRYRPSKAFLAKYQAELEALLDSIKGNYHDEIKTLYTEELYADLFIQVGEEPLKKALHKCIIASRAFKFYSTLKAFKLVEVPIEQDIIISEFQQAKKEGEAKKKKEAEVAEEAESQERSVEEEEEQKKATSTFEPTFHCGLPDNLLSPELLLNFARRAYLDQDLLEEENKLNQRLIDWIKAHRPETIKQTPKTNHSPDHRESFRTVQPDFEELQQSVAKSPSVMSTIDRQLSNVGSEIVECSDSVAAPQAEDEVSSAQDSVRDESLTGSLLTRTETFEMISRSSNPNSPIIGTPSKNAPDCEKDCGSSQQTDGESKGDASSDVSSAETPFVPTTRTGLKPKTFTTPVGLRTTNKTPASNNKKIIPAVNARDSKTPVATKTTSNQSSPRAGLTKQSSSGSANSTPPTAAKRSSLTQAASPPEISTVSDSKSAVKSKLAATGSTSATISAVKGAKPLITRAQPISLERSQSPGTNLIRGSGRNFVAANKRLIGQIESRHLQASDSQTTYDSETEISEISSFPLEPLTSDNMVAQMDKFTLISYSKLADALSKMFVDGILPDVVIKVRDNRQIEAHRCILAARSAYFAELINKQCLPLTTSESVAPTEATINSKLNIDLTEFSYPAVYFSILHIYSGIVKVPNDLDLDELTSLTHQLHVKTLRQVCMNDLRMNYCHYFHKPCEICCRGVLKTLPLAWRYDYTELYSKCLQWIGTNFAGIFCLKEFSELKPHDLLEECYSATLSQLTPENVIPKTIECQKLLKNLPRIKWTESVICLVGRQLEDFCHYVADNYEKILRSDSFLNLGKTCWECEILEENLLAAMNHLKPDSGCKTLIQLHKIECSIESSSSTVTGESGNSQRSVSESFANLVSKMRKYCERYLLKEATAVVHCSSWRHMSPSLQKRIKDQAIISTDFDEPIKQLASKPKLPSMLMRTQQSSSSSQTSADGTKSPSNRSTPESRLKSPSTTYLPPPKNKTAAARHVRVLK